MSANNQTLVKEYKGKWYVFKNLIAESFCDENGKHKNELLLNRADGVYNSRDKAFEAALELDATCGQFGEGTEYGVQFSRLCKDDSEVKIIE